MAGAPYKKGLSYFSHDTTHEQNLEYLEAETGLIGYAIYFKLLEVIYKNEGYYAKFTDRDKKFYARKWNINFDELNNIINACINEKLFNQDLYNRYQILTSTGIQKRYLRGCDRRKSINVNKDFFLLDNNSINDNTNLNNVDIISINEDKNGINVAESKVKESKVKDNKVNEIIINKFDEFWKIYPKRNNKKVGKNDCLSWWKSNIKSEKKAIEVIECTTNYNNTKTVKDGFAKDPIRFLRKDTYLDYKETIVNENSEVDLDNLPPELQFSPAG